ncbi:MAG TPA: SpoIID/LytB domain-containing protein [Tepidisphaeraceae bacterium]|jgi:stage II sporulation protein D|nr:SpoIID/LytB domain-containing protein [Tepidisphaeraceae bacterium]
MTIRYFFCLILFVSLSLTGCTPDSSTTTSVRPGTPLIRVRILERQSQVTLSSSGPPFMQFGESTAARQLLLPRNTPISLTLTSAGWQIGATSLGGAGTPLTLTPASVGSCTVNKIPYRGRYRFVPVSQNEFDVVNDLDLDSYLKGVLAREMLPKWDLEAYKAQAIVARTYALYEAKTAPKGRHYDLNDDTRSQVYGGIPAESEKSRQAVDSTSGILVVYGPPGQEHIFKAYFSACCGGVGQSASDAFGDADIPPLRARSVGSLCSASPHFNDPDLTISKSELTRRIKLWASRHGSSLQNMASLARIDILTTNSYGRPSRFFLTDTRNVRYSLRSEELRNAINADAPASSTTPTSFFTPVNYASSITFTNSHGHGHGVGLCQYCAQALAARGTRCEDIVLFSYPQSKLLRAY